MRIDILSIFPEMFAGVFDSGIIKKARDSGKVEFVLHNIRESATDAHRSVDDSPYGGGAGMVMKPDVLSKSVKAVPEISAKRCKILLSAQGELFSHALAREFSEFEQLVLVCGRYEGVDERFIERYIDREISIGDYVVGGGEIPAMVLCDAVVRLVKGVVGNKESLAYESHAENFLEYPQYTRPAEFEGLKVPEILLSGNHKEIEKWRRERSEKRTKERRPDLIKKV